MSPLEYREIRVKLGNYSDMVDWQTEYFPFPSRKNSVQNSESGPSPELELPQAGYPRLTSDWDTLKQPVAHCWSTSH